MTDGFSDEAAAVRARKNRDRPLNDKQRRFVEEYLVDLNGSAAAVRAGYSVKRSKKQASLMRKLPSVQEAIERGIAARSERVEASQDWIIDQLVENVKRSMQLAKVKVGGRETGEHSYQGSVANKSLELLGRHLGMFTDKLKLEGDFLDDLSADDLATLGKHLREAGYGTSGSDREETRH